MKLPINEIVCGDCLEVMKDWGDNCVDLVLTDPPYGIEVTNMTLGNGKQIFRRGEWDSVPMTLGQQKECTRVGTNQIFFGGNYFSLPPSPCWIVWDKNNGNSDFADGEMAWTSFSKPMRIKKVHWCGSAPKQEDSKGKVHPTQKPLQLMCWCLENYSKPDNLILDPFCGSGTTCVAAKMLGRRFIGIDISEEYCKISRQRLETVDTGIPVKEQKSGQIPLFPQVNQ